MRHINIMIDMDENTKRVFRFIWDALHDRHLSPTLREIGDGCFIAHTTVSNHLARLEGMGWIERDFNKPRSIRLGPNAPKTLPPDFGIEAEG